MVLKNTLESPLDCKEIKPVNPEGNKSWMWKDWCWSWNYNTLDTWWEELTHWKRPWCWERLKAGGEGMTEDHKVGCHHQLDGREFDQALGVGDGQGSLAWCCPWGHKELDMTEWLKWAELSKDQCVYTQLCLTLGNPLDCILPVSSVHGIFQARIWEWVAIFYSRGSSLPRDRTRVSCVYCIGR